MCAGRSLSASGPAAARHRDGGGTLPRITALPCRAESGTLIDPAETAARSVSGSSRGPLPAQSFSVRYRALSGVVDLKFLIAIDPPGPQPARIAELGDVDPPVRSKHPHAPARSVIKEMPALRNCRRPGIMISRLEFPLLARRSDQHFNAIVGQAKSVGPTRGRHPIYRCRKGLIAGARLPSPSSRTVQTHSHTV